MTGTPNMRLLLRLSYVGLIVLICGVLLVVSQYISPLVALKGSYFPLGIIIASGLYYKYPVQETTTDDKSRNSVKANHNRYRKVVFILVAAALTAASFLDSRLPALLVTLPAGYTVLALQLRTGESTEWVLAQLIALFSVGPLTKYLMTGFYFAGGDSFVHVQYVENIIRDSTTSVGTLFYRKFPGVHTLAAETSLVSHLPAYDSLILLWISIYVFFALVVFLIARLISDSTFAMCVVIATMSLSVISYYSTVIFPQAIAVVLVLFFLYLIFRASISRTAIVRYSILSTLVILAAVVTHHLTILLFAPIFVVFAGSELTNRYRTSTAISAQNDPVLRLLPIYTATVLTLGYWVLIAPNFIRAVTLQGLARYNTLSQAFASSATRTGSSSVLAFGTMIPPQTPTTAVKWLLTPTGVYYTVLTVLLCLGVVFFYQMNNKSSALLVISVIGVFGSIIMLKTPLVIKSLQRIRLVWSVFFAFLIGAGVYWATIAGSDDGTEKLVPLVLIVMLGVSGPLVAADDLKLRFDKTDQDTYLQHSLSEREYKTLRATSNFVEKSDQEVATLRTARLALARFGVSTNAPNISSEGITADAQLLLYRQHWSEYQVPYQTKLYFNTVVMSRQWLSNSVHESNKIYTTGETGLLYDEHSSISLES